MATFKFTATNGETLIGTDADDTFTLAADSDLDKTDTVLGNGGNDTILVNTVGGAALHAVANFPGVHGIENLVYSNKVTSVLLSSGSSDQFAKAGLNHIDASLVSGTVNIFAEGSGPLRIDGGLGVNTITGTDFNDRVRIKADTFTIADGVNLGGHGAVGTNPDLYTLQGDVLELYSTKAVTLDMNALIGSTHAQTLALSGTGMFTVTLGKATQASSITHVDAGAVTGNVLVDVSARTDTPFVDITSKNFGATDTIIGNGHTTLGVTDKAAILDAAFKNVSGIQQIEVYNNAATTDYTGAKITLGLQSASSGISKVVNSSDHDLIVDAGLRSGTIQFNGDSANDTLIGGSAQNNFIGGGGDDTLSLKVGGSNLTGNDFFFGGIGTDTFRVIESNNAATLITDAAFTGFKSVEKVVFDATGAQNVTFGAEATEAGIVTIDASKLTGNLTLNAVGMTNTIEVFAGSGKDNITINGDSAVHSEVHFASTKLNALDALTSANDTYAELHLDDSVHLSDTYFTALATNVHDFIQLSFDNAGQGQSLTAGDKFATFITNSTIVRVNATTDQGFTFDFSKYTGNSLILTGGGGNDVFNAALSGAGWAYNGGAGDDSFRAGAAAIDQALIDGGDGFRDELVLLDDGTNQLVDFNLDDTTGVEILKLGAAKSVGYDITLGANAKTSGMTNVDASLAAVDVKVDASGMTGKSVFMTAGAKNNDFLGANLKDTFSFATATFNGSDKVGGGTSGKLGDILLFTTGGAIAAGAFAGTQQIERIFLSDAGNTITLTDALLATSEGLNGLTPLLDGTVLKFEVEGGKGADKVDLSQLTNATNNILVGAGLGNDTLIGGVGNDHFAFFNDGGLTTADKIGGGGGHDTVFVQLGTYGADVFKNMTSIEEVAFGAFAGTGTATNVKMNNDAFKGADLNPDGTKDMTIHIYAGGDSTVDASAVTGPANRVTAIFDNVGKDTFLGGAGADMAVFTDGNGNNFAATDKVDGGAGFDSLKFVFNNAGSKVADADFAGVSHVERVVMDFDTGTLNKVTLGANAVAAGITEVLDISNPVSDTGGANLDASGFTGDLTVTVATQAFGSHYDLGSGDDEVRFLSNDGVFPLPPISILYHTMSVDGGIGHDTLTLVGAPGIVTLLDSEFGLVSNFDVLKFDKSGSSDGFEITLNGAADTAGFSEIDATGVGSNGLILHLGSKFDNALTYTGSEKGDIFDATASSSDTTVISGGGADSLQGGSGDNRWVFQATTLSGNTIGDSTLGVGNDFSNASTIENFDGDHDVIDFSAFGFDTGGSYLFVGTAVGGADETANRDLLITSVIANGFQNNSDIIVGFTSGAGASTYVFADANQNHIFDLNGDIIIKVTGVSEFTLGQNNIFDV
jgi:hypothetical protein